MQSPEPRHEIEFPESEIPMSQASPFVGPMTSTQIDSGVVIPDTEDQLEYKQRYEPPGEFGVSCRHCSEFVVANSVDSCCLKCGYKL
jgi:hypothetical protein